MARLFPKCSLFWPPLPPMMLSLLIVAAIVSVFSIVAFLCGSDHLHGRPNNDRRKFHIKITSKSRGKKLRTVLTKSGEKMKVMLSFKKLQVDGEENYVDALGPHDLDRHGYEEEDGEEAIWRKKILLGERCRPLKFPEKVANDSRENQTASDHYDLSKGSERLET